MKDLKHHSFRARLRPFEGFDHNGQTVRFHAIGALDTWEGELNRAIILPPEEIPPYVVTMYTCVRLIDLTTGKTMTHTLVFPSDEDLQQGKLSILSDLGVAIIGFSVGNTVEWQFPEGLKSIRIDMIYFQPEATKQYEM